MILTERERTDMEVALEETGLVKVRLDDIEAGGTAELGLLIAWFVNVILDVVEVGVTAESLGLPIAEKGYGSSEVVRMVSQHS